MGPGFPLPPHPQHVLLAPWAGHIREASLEEEASACKLASPQPGRMAPQRCRLWVREGLLRPGHPACTSGVWGAQLQPLGAQSSRERGQPCRASTAPSGGLGTEAERPALPQTLAAPPEGVEGPLTWGQGQSRLWTGPLTMETCKKRWIM